MQILHSGGHNANVDRGTSPGVECLWVILVQLVRAGVNDPVLRQPILSPVAPIAKKVREGTTATAPHGIMLCSYELRPEFKIQDIQSRMCYRDAATLTGMQT